MKTFKKGKTWKCCSGSFIFLGSPIWPCKAKKTFLFIWLFGRSFIGFESDKMRQNIPAFIKNFA